MKIGEHLEDDDDDSYENKWGKDYFFFDPITRTYLRNNEINIVSDELCKNPDCKRDDIEGFAWMLADPEKSYSQVEMELLRKQAEADYSMRNLMRLGLAEWVIDDNGVIGYRLKETK